MSDSVHGEHFTAVPPRLIVDGNLSAQAVRIYAAIRSHLRPNGRGMFPRQDTLAEMCACSVPTVQRAVAELVGAGWLTREQKPRRNGQLGVNHYYLAVPAITDDARPGITGDGRPGITDDAPEVEGEGSRNGGSNEPQRAPASAGATSEIDEFLDLIEEVA